MSNALSIQAAAQAYPQRIALIAAEEQLTYQQLATRIAKVDVQAPNLQRATPPLSTAFRLYASLQHKQCLALVSPNSSDAEISDLKPRLAAPECARAALVLFTSGSSGASKGVLLSHQALIASAVAANRVLGWAEGDRWLCCLPLSHIGGISVLTRALSARRTAILCERFEARAVARDILRHRATHISLVPTMLWRLLEHGFRAPSHLRVTLMGGAALDESLATRARDAGFLLRPSYGMTETASMVVCDGHPLPGVQLRIAANQALSVRAPMLMNGYLPPNAGKTGESPIRDGWFLTTDKARDPDGHLEILGRLDATIISGGENIDLAEVEAALNAHPRVQSCLAVGVPDAEWGHRLVVLVVCDGAPSTIEVEKLRGHKRPKKLLRVEALPLLENGKPDRRQATQLAMQSEH